MLSILALAGFLFFPQVIRHVLESIETRSIRWDVKTLTDRDTAAISFRAVWTTIEEQANLAAPTVGGNSPRLESERTLYTLDCDLLGVKHEIDGDYHLVIRAPSSSTTLIAEIPDNRRQEVGKTSHTMEYRTARLLIDSIAHPAPYGFTPLAKPVRLRITGIGFFDEPHLIEQEGSATNAREIHPVLRIELIQ